MTAQAGRAAPGSAYEELRISELRVGRRSVLAVSGEIDIATVDVLRVAVERVLASPAADVWIDLSEVGFMDSTGIKVLLHARSELSRAPRHFAVICPPGPVRRVLRIAGVEPALAIHADRASAHAAA